ncbi:hypothetical protein M9H77_28355 [Catharanthus roseus]|uniref:Uncharacterized protein n=1 Tax=Catharanthus roseus TaxID=4058 RepID=A0ACC0AF35_CATRO|nr:hypothetical protein M9H77_28355 [Catharanthus roseus]
MYVRYAFDPNNKMFSGASLDWFERRIGPYVPTSKQLGIYVDSGRLSCSCTGDGKRRVFAIGNYVNQRLLALVHDWLASVLRLIPMDGTFDQLAPLDRMKHHRGYAASVDLKSATDRWPLLLLFKVMCALFDRSFASAVVNATLATNIFTVGFVKKKPSFVSFVAAEQVYPGVKFTDYAILGDDLVIFDRAVAEKYMELFKTELQVGISVSKNIVLPPNEVFPYEGMRDFNEYSLYRSWMDQYLIYLKWYCQVVLDPCVTIDQITSDPPIYIRTWYMPEVDLSTFRYGIMFRVIDVVGCLLNSGIKFFPLNQTP